MGNDPERQAGNGLIQRPGKELGFCSDCSRVLLKDVKQENGII